MTIHHVALLLGMFGIPLVALMIGFKFRKRTTRTRAIFWGAILGHGIATVVASVAAIWPPRALGPGDDARGVLILWTLLLGGLIGIAVALLVSNRGRTAKMAIVPVLAMFGTQLLGCASDGALPSPVAAIDSVTSPAAPGSSEPNLAVTPAGDVLMTWMERGADSAYALRIASFDGETWTTPATIVHGREFFVNWADFPSVVALPDGRLAAHWLQRSDSGTYDYDVHIAQSQDGGQTWSEGVIPHRDGTKSEHGFATLYDAGRDLLGAVWLDGRKFAGEQPTREMTLAHTTLAADGSLGEERIVDERICDCCQTSGAITAKGPVIVYRDRSPGEIRDISIVRFTDGAWSAPRPVHEDGWHVAHCPVNGPAVSADGSEVAVAWFTAANDTARVNVAFSSDAGDSFGAPIRIDAGTPLGRVDVELLGQGRAAVTWLERVEDGAEVRLRSVSADGRASDPVVLGRSTEGRSSGFPRMARQDDHLIFAWTVTGRPSSVNVTRARIQ